MTSDAQIGLEARNRASKHVFLELLALLQLSLELIESFSVEVFAILILLLYLPFDVCDVLIIDLVLSSERSPFVEFRLHEVFHRSLLAEHVLLDPGANLICDFCSETLSILEKFVHHSTDRHVIFHFIFVSYRCFVFPSGYLLIKLL